MNEKLTIDLERAPKEELSSIRAVCFDIDDTFSSEGKILASTFSALWELKKAGYILIPVTGRPAGWCDHIVRFWPVDAVIGENGAFVFYMHEGKRQRYDVLPTVEVKENARKLDRLAQKIKHAFPEVTWASDQAYRECDLAIDFCEDVEPWAVDKIEQLVKLCRDNGAIAKVSSIHVNTWYGVYDKHTTFKKWLEDIGLQYLALGKFDFDEWVYIGDSPNDEPAFKFFKKSVGVANLKDFFDQLKYQPTWMTTYNSGKGFEELAQRLLNLKC